MKNISKRKNANEIFHTKKCLYEKMRTKFFTQKMFIRKIARHYTLAKKIHQ